MEFTTALYKRAGYDVLNVNLSLQITLGLATMLCTFAIALFAQVLLSSCQPHHGSPTDMSRYGDGTVGMIYTVNDDMASAPSPLPTPPAHAPSSAPSSDSRLGQKRKIQKSVESGEEKLQAPAASPALENEDPPSPPGYVEYITGDISGAYILGGLALSFSVINTALLIWIAVRTGVISCAQRRSGYLTERFLDARQLD
ncbi:hypothetical protein CYMTET_46738 [Cymbomonas tetramitiformis]|uniref:Uncharacterized protein n=1 Tax=Cymbomonas tetramitiformis TaxID=36881 RepID=A0AAE0EYE3_9CHLO|nr:hypothetical protein CYMTET_46738 [Cymbomonas tetramitiformis]